MNNNLGLANFIVSFGSMNDYSSSVLQTKRALDLHDLSKLAHQHHDGEILQDALDGIAAAEKFGFSKEGIIEINKSFTHSKEEDPNLPGHLRKASSNPDDAVVIITNSRGTAEGAYFAPENVYPEDLDAIVNEYNSSKQTIRDAWRVFAQLSKLQPFQDGNKRTALIAANSAYNTWKSKNYLTLPFDDIDHAEFMLGLMRFYRAHTKEQEEQALDRMIAVLPSQNEVEYHLNRSLEQKDVDINDLKTKRVKSFYKNNFAKKEKD
ncbi:Fic family protein [Lactobacillus kefiranofaciens]|uniref:Fic family protein n=1 Tax=Lactobacillus kefiranofaciens TaxID=267818 RepID=UPI00246857F5|nr:Fic family protein [Lactobacillus kefiranofaciens]MDH5100999.1 Fic family protein [Lactobacillus kefiranofaciens]